MKKQLLLGGLIGVSAGLYFLFRNQPEKITIEDFTLPQKTESTEGVSSKQMVLVSSDGLSLGVSVVTPTQQPIKAVIQIVHGILEHRLNYLEFAEFLANQGFATVISDNRGHGESFNPEFPLGHMPGVSRMVQDQVEMTHWIKQHFVGKPVYLYGHSFGSMIARVYLQEHDQEIDKLLLTGTVYSHPLVKIGCSVADLAIKISGERSFSWIMKKLSNFNSDDFAWLTNDLDQIEKIKIDPRRIPGYDNLGNATIMHANKELKNRSAYHCQHPNLPILSITGEEDVVITGGKKGLIDTEKTLRAMGYQKVQRLNLPNMKHEVLNEVDRLSTYQLIANFFES